MFRSLPLNLSELYSFQNAPPILYLFYDFLSLSPSLFYFFYSLFLVHTNLLPLYPCMQTMISKSIRNYDCRLCLHALPRVHSLLGKGLLL